VAISNPTKAGSIFFEVGSAKPELEQSQSSLAEVNKVNLRQILQTFDRYKPGQSSLRVTLKGYATNLPIRGGLYSSNYELAQARIEAVRILLSTASARKFDIAWILVPNVTEDLAGERPERKVDVEIQEVSRSTGVRILTLLEYLYFTTYTITTTGYGDIIPRSPLAMFICTLANWYEVFFVVVFFNAVLSTRERYAEEDS
jgi:hypothetical protein